MRHKIDIKRITDGNVIIHGWVLPDNLEHEVVFNLYKNNEKIEKFTFARTKRSDVAEVYLKNYTGNDYFGFNIEFPFDDSENTNYQLVITAGKEKTIENINKKSIIEFNSFEHKKHEQIIAYFNNETFKRAFEFLCKEGPISFIKKTIRKVKGLQVDYDYAEWRELTKLSDDELTEQRNNSFKYKPKFSIVIPIYDTDENFLKLLFKSIFEQTYTNFEICVADATNYSSSKNNPKKYLEKLKNEGHNNLHIKYLDKNISIANNTNEAIKMATGDYIVLCDHDDELSYNALYENAKLINEYDNALLIYSDEDKIDTKSKDYFEPAFKPDFNLDMLLAVNYFCHLTTIKKSLLDELYSIDKEYERTEYNGAQDYDLFLRLVNLIIRKYDVKCIKHIPKVLYHWRCHKLSTSKNVNSKDYAFINGAKAVSNFYQISKINSSRVLNVEKGFDFGLYHTIFEKSDEQLISIIIPNKDHIDDLKLAMSSVENGNYKNIEFVICENNSTDEKTFEFYKELERKKNVKVVTYKDKFNYSKINNYASKYANGDYLLFLNNDVEMINNDSLFEMINYLKRNDVGAVGSKLLYKDKTIQHAGVILGLGGAAGHAFVGMPNFDHSYMNRAHIVQDLSAVTAACIMVKKSVFEEINGFDEKLEVAFNDIDLCIKIREKGYLIVYNPYSCFFHYESKSRGYEDTKEKVDRFNKETALLLKKWKDVLFKIDEYYNPNLTLRKADFSLRNLKFEKIGEPFNLPEKIRSLMNEV